MVCIWLIFVWFVVWVLVVVGCWVCVMCLWLLKWYCWMVVFGLCWDWRCLIFLDGWRRIDLFWLCFWLIWNCVFVCLVYNCCICWIVLFCFLYGIGWSCGMWLMLCGFCVFCVGCICWNSGSLWFGFLCLVVCDGLFGWIGILNSCICLVVFWCCVFWWNVLSCCRLWLMMYIGIVCFVWGRYWVLCGCSGSCCLLCSGCWFLLCLNRCFYEILCVFCWNCCV